MSQVAELRLRMYLTLFLVFAIGFAIFFVLLGLLGVSSIGIVIFALLFFLMQWYVSPAILSKVSRLQYIKKNEYPKLHEMVEKLAKQAGVPVPKIAISPSKDPNAFVFGRTRRSATLVVHKGMLDIATDDELYAVLAHEIGHLKHNDVVVMTFVSFIPMLAYLVAMTFLWGGMLNGNRNGGAYAALIGISAFFVYFVSELLMLALSRTRESFADSYSAQATQKPEDLASALTKITYKLASSKPTGNSVARSFYIADNFTAKKDVSTMEKHLQEIKKAFPNLDFSAFKSSVANEASNPFSFFGAMFMTHPPTYKRILMLARMKNEEMK